MNVVTKKSVAPFKLDPRIREYFDARLDAIFATSVEDSNEATHRATKILWDLDAEQRGYVASLARSFGRAFQ
jgi:hypothetical protein